jgi:hypothetical protein
MRFLNKRNNKYNNPSGKNLNFFQEHKSIIQTVLSFAGIIIAVIALLISKQAIEDAAINSKNADSLFNVQLNNERIYNDSIIANLKDMQELTSKQIQIIDEQLNVGRLSYEDQKVSKRAQLIINGIFYDEGNEKNGEDRKDLISVNIKNVGQNYAYDVQTRLIICRRDFSEIKSGIYNSKENLGPNVDVLHSTGTFKEDTKLPFYLTVEVIYFDKISAKKYSIIKVLCYQANNDKFSFYSCDEDEKEKIKKTINKHLKQEDLPLLIE